MCALVAELFVDVLELFLRIHAIPLCVVGKLPRHVLLIVSHVLMWKT